MTLVHKPFEGYQRYIEPLGVWITTWLDVSGCGISAGYSFPMFITRAVEGIIDEVTT